MNKNAIKNFVIDAIKKDLISEINIKLIFILFKK